jgi:hypothetical protein
MSLFLFELIERELSTLRASPREAYTTISCNYARWMPVHIRDMKHLPDPIRDGFDNQGHWVLSKTNNAFSAIPIDEAHE